MGQWLAKKKKMVVVDEFEPFRFNCLEFIRSYLEAPFDFAT